jgi:hypothetical protein
MTALAPLRLFKALARLAARHPTEPSEAVGAKVRKGMRPIDAGLIDLHEPAATRVRRRPRGWGAKKIGL